MPRKKIRKGTRSMGTKKWSMTVNVASFKEWRSSKGERINIAKEKVTTTSSRWFVTFARTGSVRPRTVFSTGKLSSAMGFVKRQYF